MSRDDPHRNTKRVETLADLRVRQAYLDDDNILVSASAMIRACERIIASKEPRHFLHTAEGIAFLNAAYSMTGVDALYDLKLDCEHAVLSEQAA